MVLRKLFTVFHCLLLKKTHGEKFTVLSSRNSSTSPKQPQTLSKMKLISTCSEHTPPPAS